MVDFAGVHRPTLDAALQAIRSRDYWSPYPETPKAYGDPVRAQAAYEALLDRDLPLVTPGAEGWVSTEVSRYGGRLGVRYPHPADLDRLLGAALAALPAWRDAGAETRTGVCLEILHRINERSLELGYAVMHTTGQAYVMAFQAGGPHAQDRGLEAVAYAYAEMTRHPAEATWTKPQGKRPPLALVKRFTVVPRGVALVVGCATFPTWNGYPGLFASLVTGNPVVVKPHPRAVLPLAITVQVAQQVLAEAGLPPELVTLAAEDDGEGLASQLATRPEVRIVDFTGSTAYGEWLERHATQAQVYTEKAGVNSVVIDSYAEVEPVAANLAFSLALYSGQMCTAPQNILVRRELAEEVGAALRTALDRLLGEDARAVELTGALVNDDVLARVQKAPSYGEVVVPSRVLRHPVFPASTARTPVVVRVDPADEEVYAGEHFGPVAFLIPTESTEESLAIWRRTAAAHGALTASVYSTNEAVLGAAEQIAWEVGVALSCNLTDGVYVNQSAGFSDFHATGANPAANACLTDAAFVAGRFRVVQARRHLG